MKMKKELKLKIFIILLSAMVIIFLIKLMSPIKQDYKIILDGEEVEELIKCEDIWNYQNKTFIPCVWNETIGGIPADFINWSFSPQENCHSWNGTFPGFNIENETRNKELYDEVTPKCIKIGIGDIDEEFLEGCECELYSPYDLYPLAKNMFLQMIRKTDIIKKELCGKYKCSENLEIIKN